VLLGLDLLGSVAPETLRTLDPARTVAIVNIHQTATAAMVVDPANSSPPLSAYVDQLEAAALEARFLDAGALSQALFADHMPANVIMLGAAYQHGCLPVSAEAIARAIELNGAGVETNLSALAWGRAAAAAPAAVAEALAARRTAPVRSGLQSAAAPALRRRIDAGAPHPALAALIDHRAGDLADYQDATYARGYVDDVLTVLIAERRHGSTEPEHTPVTEAYARAMHKLMAYKDEYEVARLHLDTIERARLDTAFGPGAEVQILLHPPLLRALGMNRKLRLGASARPLFTVLRAARRLRGTTLDPFGRSALRALERALVDEHRALTRTALARLTPETQDEVARIAGLTDLIRGYEEIKLANVERYRAAAAQALAALPA
jgi:indolepyruvate ferredoxin oxidoreductase